MINGIPLNNLRNNDLSQFLLNILKAVNRYDPALLFIPEEYLSLENVSNAIVTMLNAGGGNFITEELEALDVERDDAFNGTLSIINGFLYSKDESLKAHAKRLTKHLAGFGPAVARETYQNQTSKMQKIVLDWDTEADLKAAITALNLDTWKTDLQTANEAFDNRYVDRSIDKYNLDKLKAKRLEANDVYYEFRDNLFSHYTLKKKVAPFSLAVDAMNGVIKDYNDLLARRGDPADIDMGATTATVTTEPV